MGSLSSRNFTIASYLSSISITSTKHLKLASIFRFSSLIFPSQFNQFTYLSKRVNCRHMATNSASNVTGKKCVRIDISSDTVCPWCFVGKRNLDKAISKLKDQFDFEIRWHPFLLNPSAPKEGVNKRDFYRQKFGPRSEQIIARMTDVFRGLGLEYNIEGLTGSTLDSHRLIYYAGQKGLDKQHDLVEELFLGYFTRAKYIRDREFLLESARKVGIEGAADFLEDPNNGLKEVMEELEKHSSNISGVPYFVINNERKLSGGQPPDVFLKALKLAAN